MPLKSGLFAETWSEKLYTSIEQGATLYSILEHSRVTTAFPESSSLGRQLEMTSRMIKARQRRETQRDVFFVTLNGFDTHADDGTVLSAKFTEVNNAIQSFVTEMTRQNVWNNVVLIEASDFGRTLTPNNNGGTDHGWGGNYFLIGGGVKGGRILGRYPSDLTDNGEQSIKRGRVLPSTSWQTVWNGVGEWFGITTDAELDEVLPDRDEFNDLMNREDLFV